ncbi:hypothetical protein L0Y65_05640, partial [Candidatus Micrarchaeota archaeon]|nr:hypothetical protein [Candidatus Micrarchaeota archaeon]
MGKERQAERPEEVHAPTPQPAQPAGPMIQQAPVAQAKPAGIAESANTGLAPAQAQADGIRQSAPPTKAELNHRLEDSIQALNKYVDLNVGGHDYQADAGRVGMLLLVAKSRIDGTYGVPMDLGVAQQALDFFGQFEARLSNTKDAHTSVLSIGTPQSGIVGDSIGKSLDMLFTQPSRVDATVEAARDFASRPEVYADPRNAAEWAKFQGSLGQLSNASVPMTEAQISSALQSVHQGFEAAAARFEGQVTMQLQAMLAQVQMLSATGKMKDELDRLKKDIEKLLKESEDKKKSEGEKEKEASGLEGRLQKIGFAVLETALEEAGAPPQLISALKRAREMVSKNARKLMLSLGLTYLSNREAFSDPKSRESLGNAAEALVAAAKKGAAPEYARKVMGEVQSFIRSAQAKGRAIGEAAARALEERTGLLKKAAEFLERAEKSEPNETLRKAYSELRGEISRLLGALQQKDGLKKTEQQFGRLLGAIKSAQMAFEKLSRTPEESEEQKKDKASLGTLFANAIRSAIEDPASEKTKMLQSLAEGFTRTLDAGLRGRICQWGEAIARNRSVDEIKGDMCSFLSKKAESVLGMITDAKTKDALGSFLGILREPKKAGADDLHKALHAVSLGERFARDIAPKAEKDGKLKEAASRFFGRAAEALRLGAHDEASFQMDLAKRYVESPPKERDAAEKLSLRVRSSTIQARQGARESGAEAAQRDRARSSLQRERAEIPAMLSGAPKALKNHISGLLGAIDKALGRLGDPAESEGVSIDELKILFSRITALKKAAAEMKKSPGTQAGNETEAVLGAALSALERNDTKSYEMLVFAASEIGANRGSGKDSASMRKEVLAGVKALEAAKTPDERDAALASIRKPLSLFLTSALDKADRGGRTNAHIAIGRLKEAISEEGAGAEIFARARQAISAVESLDGALRAHRPSRGEKAGDVAKAASALLDRALDVLGTDGGDIQAASALAFIALKYVDMPPGTTREELGALSERIAQDPAAAGDMQTYISVNDKAAAIRKQMGQLPKDGPAHAALGRIAAELERVKAAIATGQDLIGDERVQARVPYVNQMYAGNGQIRAQINRIAQGALAAAKEAGGEITPEDAFKRAVLYCARETENAAEKEKVAGLIALSDILIRGGRNPDPKLLETASNSASAYLALDIDSGKILADAAAVFMAHPDRRAREEAYAIAGGLSSKRIGMPAASFMLGLLSVERTGLEGAVKDRSQRLNGTAYLDLALIAARNGDMEGAIALKRAGMAYLRLAGANPANLAESERKARTDAMAQIESQFGDFRKNADIQGGKRLLDAGGGGKAAWQPAPGSMEGAVAEGVISKKSLRDSLGPSFKEAEAASIDASSASQKIAGAAGLNALSGMNASENRRRDAQWKAEAGRLSQLAEAARKAKDEPLAEYYESEAARTDTAFVLESAAKAKGFLERGAEESAEADKLDAGAAEKEADARTASKAGQGARAAQLNAEAASLRAEAEGHRGASGELIGRAMEIRADLEALDASVRTINTRHRESGRLSLGIAVKTNIALGEGHDADSMGEPLVRIEADEHGEMKAAPAAGLNPKRAAQLSAQAEQASAAGRQEVAGQRQIMGARNAGLASAKESLHDFSIAKAGELITKLIARVPRAKWAETIQTHTGLSPSEEEMKDPGLFLRRVFSGNVREGLPSASAAGMQKLYFALANMTGTATGFTDENGETKTAFDPLENEKRYQAAVGMWWSENFGGASSFTRQARFSMQSGAFIANVYADAKELRAGLSRASGPEGSGFVVGSRGPHGMGFVDKGDYNLIKQLIAHMPEAERPDLYADLERCGRGSEGQFTRELLFDKLGPYTGITAEKIINGDPVYYNESELIGSAVEARAKAARGDLGGAEKDLGAAEGKAYRDFSMQQADNERVSFDFAEFSYSIRTWKSPADLLREVTPGAKSDDKKAERERLAVQGVRDDMQKSAGAYSDALRKRARENSAASKAALGARDAIGRSGKFRLDGAAMLTLLSSVEGMDEKLRAQLGTTIGLEGDALEKRVGEIWEGTMERNPALMMMAARAARSNPSFDKDQAAQITAVIGANFVRSQNQDWDMNVEPVVRGRIAKELKFRRDILQTRDKDEKRKLRENANDSRDGAIAMAEHGYDFAKDAKRMAAITQHNREDNKRDWDMILSRTVEDRYSTDRPGEEGYRSESRKYAEKLSVMETDLQLLAAGFRRKEDGTLEQVEMTPGERERVAEAYSQFTMLKSSLQARVASTDAALAWGAESGYLRTVVGRMEKFYESAEMVTHGTQQERQQGAPDRRIALARSATVFQSAEPIGRDGIDYNFRTRDYSEDMANVQAGVDIGVGVVKTAAYGVAFAVGGPVAWVAGGAGAVEGAIGTYDYYEACGGDWDMMTTGESAMLIFQGVMAAGSAVAPFLGEARTAVGGVEEAVGVLGRGTMPMSTRVLEGSKAVFGYAMIGGGLVQSGFAIYDIAEADSSVMPTWAKVTNAVLQGLQGGVQPGLHVLRSRQAAKTGLPAQRSRGIQIGEMLLFGTPLDDAAAIRTQYAEGLERSALNAEVSRLAAPERAAFEGYAQARNAASPGEQLDIVMRFQQSKAVNPDITFSNFTAINSRFENARKSNPDARFEDFALSEAKMNREELRARSRAAQEAKKETDEGMSIPDLRRRSAELARQADALPRERAGEAVDLIRRANAFDKEADRRRSEAEQGVRAEFTLSVERPDAGGQEAHTLGPEGTAGYGERNVRAAVELASAGELVADGQMSIDEAAGRLRENLKAKGIEVDSRQASDALMSLFVGRREFSSGNALGGYADTKAEGRRMQMMAALDVVSEKMPGMEKPIAVPKAEANAEAEAPAPARELHGEKINAMEGEAQLFERFDQISPERLRDMAESRKRLAGEKEGTDAEGAAMLRRQAAALDAEAQSRQERGPEAKPQNVARRAEPAARVSPAELLAVMRERAARSGEEAWTQGGQEADLGTLLRTIEDSVVTMAQGGQESDILVFSGDKSMLNSINNLFGHEWGDIGISAYREIVRLAMLDVARQGDGTFFLRPGTSDETTTILVVRPGRGEQVRSQIKAAMERATERVFMGADSPYAEAIAAIGPMVIEPRRLVSATGEVSQPVQIRRQENGRVTATYPDGTSAYVTRPDGKAEFLTHAVTATDDPAYAGPLRKALKVAAQPNRAPALLNQETAEVEAAWGKRNAPHGESEKALNARTEAALRGNGVNPEQATPIQLREAIVAVARERAVMADTETVASPSVAFEIRLSIPDRAALGQVQAALPKAGKGVAEVLTNSFGIRALNTFTGHDGANAVINIFDGLVAKYAGGHGLRVRELGTLKYVIEGGTKEQVRQMYADINRQMEAMPEAQRIGFRISDRSPAVTIEAGADASTARTRVSNGHMVVERRGRAEPRGAAAGRAGELPEGWTEAQARATDWDGESKKYSTANAIISAFNSKMATEPFLRQLLGEQYEALRPVIELVRAKSEIIGSDAIRNFEDLIIALRDPRIGGGNGRILEGAFRSFVVEHGAEFRLRLDEAVPPAPRVKVRPQEEAKPLEMRLAAGMGAQELRRPTMPPPAPRSRPTLRLVPREGSFAQEARAPATETPKPATAKPSARPAEPKAAPPFASDGELRQLASDNQAEKVGAVTKFAKLTREEQFGVLSQMREKGMDSRAQELSRGVIIDYLRNNETGAHAQLSAAFLSLGPQKRAQIIAGLREMQAHDGATYLNELSQLSHGKAGGTLESVYGVSREEAVKAYSSASSLSDAREALAKAMGIEIAPFEWAAMPNRDWVSKPYQDFNKAGDDHFFFGMLLSGDMPGHMNEVGAGMYPGQDAQARIVSSRFRNGAVGAYEVVIEITRKVPDPSGTGSIVKERKTVYVKRQDLRPDAAGVEYSLESGIPAPRIHAATARGEMGYTTHDGSATRYGILENMGDFHGNIRMAGRDYGTRAVSEMSVGDLATISALHKQLDAETDHTRRAGLESRMKEFSPAQMELYGHVTDMLNSPDPEIRAAFWREFGQVLSASYAIGLWDRHEINLRVMRLEIDKPLGAAEAAELKANGYSIEHDAATGRTTLFKIGGIDTDAAGAYMANESGGTYEFRNMNWRFGYTDLHRLFESLSHVTGKGVDSLVHDAFGNVNAARDAAGRTAISGSLTGPIGEGVMRFWNEHGNDPQYRAGMEARFRSHEGEPIGMGYPLGAEDLAGLRSPARVAEFNAPQSGDPFTQVVSEDGRSENRNYEISSGNVLAALHPDILAMFPPGKDMFVFQLTPEARASLPAGM